MLLSDVRTALNEVLCKAHLAEQLYTRFSEVLGTSTDNISAYGYLTYLKSKYGEKAAFPNLILSATLIQEFNAYSNDVCAIFPQHVLSTCDRLSKMIELFGIEDIDIILDRLADSADKAVVFAALCIQAPQLNSPVVVTVLQDIKDAAADYFKRYPKCALNLPPDVVSAIKERLE